MQQVATVCKPVKMTNPRGFTLIELLIVVSIIGILTGVTVSVINVTRSQNIAKDAVRASTLEKLVQGLEAYTAAEGTNPLDTNTDGNPLNVGSGSEDVVGIYLSSWPTSEKDALGNLLPYYYAKITENSKEFLCVSVPMATEPTKFIKYVSPYSIAETGGSAVCGKRVVRNCSTGCSQGTSGNNIGDCSLPDGTLCQ